MTPNFADITAPRPDRDSLAAQHAAIDARLDAGDRAGALALWDQARRDHDTWSALVHLRFAQDTRDAQAVADREYADALAPEAATHETALKRRLLADADRAGLEALAGAHAVALWETDITAFDPAIAAESEEESRLSARYTALMAGARVAVRGHEVNLAGLAPFAEDPDRALRHEAEAARWSFLAANGEELDSIYDGLVRLRTAWRASWATRPSRRSATGGCGGSTTGRAMSRATATPSRATSRRSSPACWNAAARAMAGTG
jgi:oligoendopeptidase F